MSSTTNPILSNVPNVSGNQSTTDISNALITPIAYGDVSMNVRPSYAGSANWRFGKVDPYIGSVYAFYAEGGYTIDQCFNTIKLIPESKLYTYDVTTAVQVLFDVRTFNEKIGLYKDSTNQYVLASSFDPIRDCYTTWDINTEEGGTKTQLTSQPMLDKITITADEFVKGLITDYVVSVGTYSTIYKNFNTYVNEYFGYAGGFSSLFSGASEFDYNNGIFDASALINIINPYYTASGENVKKLTGTITIPNINNLLKYAVNTNVFNNRNPYTDLSSSDPGLNTEIDRDPALGGSPTYPIDASMVTNTLTQPVDITPPINDQQTHASTYKSNWGMGDGFVAGDLIYVPAGTTITLHLVIDSESLAPLNNIGPANVGTTNAGNGTITSTTTTTTTISGNTVSTTSFVNNSNQGGQTSNGSSVTKTTNVITPITTTDPYYNNYIDETHPKVDITNPNPKAIATGRNFNAFYSQTTSATELNIDRTLTAPLLIKLVNITTDYASPNGTYKGGFNNTFSGDVTVVGDDKNVYLTNVPNIDPVFHNDNFYDANNIGFSLTEIDSLGGVGYRTNGDHYLA